jgi:hypothetical protein
MPWIPGGAIPACPCGAPSEDQVRRTSGGETLRWFCLVCQTPRQPRPDWADPLLYVTRESWRSITRRMESRARQRGS